MTEDKVRNAHKVALELAGQDAELKHDAYLTIFHAMLAIGSASSDEQASLANPEDES